MTKEMDSRRRWTEEMDEHIRHVCTHPDSPFNGITYISVFECDFAKEQKDNADLRQFVDEYKRLWSPKPLKTREAVRGGRTNSIIHFVPELGPLERLFYFDFTR